MNFDGDHLSTFDLAQELELRKRLELERLRELKFFDNKNLIMSWRAWQLRGGQMEGSRNSFTVGDVKRLLPSICEG